MESEVLKAALSQGLWAVLFVTLFWWVLKENKAREDRYLVIIQTLSQDVKDRLGKVEEDLGDLLKRR